MTRKEQNQYITDCLTKGQYNLAFEFAVEQFTEPLYWQIRKIVLLHEDTDDVLQETFTKIWQKIDSFQGNASFYTWSYKIATNEALNHLRKQKIKTVDFITDEAEEQSHIYKLKAEPLLEEEVVYQQLLAAIATLPEKQQTVFHLRYFNEMSYKEISAELNTSVGALRASFHHALTKVEEHLKTNSL